jgi:oxazoline/thiazoline synthase
VRAFLELVERDAAAIWWYNRIARPALDPSALKEPIVAAYRNWTRSRGRELALHDLTHDLRIPVVAAVSHDRDGGSIALGFGADVSAAAAARHAVGELAQFEANLSLIAARAARRGTRGLAPEARALLRWASSARLRDHPYLAGQPTRPEPLTLARLTLGDCHALSRNHGLPFLAVELTRPGLDIPVCRVVVPGLRPLWARFAAGRLFDVPVRIGWRTATCPAESLNPVPLMF